MDFAVREFVFEDEEGIIEGNRYFARPNREVKDEEGNTVMKNGKPLVEEDAIIPFLKREGYVEVINGKKKKKEVIKTTENEEVEF